MSDSEKNYEIKVLSTIVRKYLDASVSMTEEGLSALEDSFDEVVWDLSTKIFSLSGHKIELSIVKNIVRSKVESIKDYLNKNENIEGYQLDQRRYQEFCAEKYDIPIELEQDQRKAFVFFRVRKVICEELSISKNEVELDSHLFDHLNIDELDLVEITMALEEEFGIEISDDEIESELAVYSKLASHGRQKLQVAYVYLIFLDLQGYSR